MPGLSAFYSDAFFFDSSLRSYFLTTSFTSWYETTINSGQVSIQMIDEVYIVFNFGY